MPLPPRLLPAQTARSALTWALQRFADPKQPVGVHVATTVCATVRGPYGEAAIVREGSTPVALSVRLELPAPLTPHAVQEAPWRAVFLALHEAAHIETFLAGHVPINAKVQHGAHWRRRFVDSVLALSPRVANVPETSGSTFGRAHVGWEESFLRHVALIDPNPVFPWSAA